MNNFRNRRVSGYAAVIVASALLGWLVSYAVPEEYAAQVKISDEYKTTDLAIGLNTINVMMRDMNINNGNEGTDDIEIYSKIIKSEDYIASISRITIPEYNQTYSDYLKANYPHRKDILELIRDNINYNISTNTQTVDLQVKDKDPDVAVYVLDQALSLLKQEIESKRTRRAVISKENADKKRQEAFLAYQNAKNDYTGYADSHLNSTSQYALNRLEQLEQDYKIKYDMYEKAQQEYVRADYLVNKENISFVIVKVFNISKKRISPYRWAYALAAMLISCSFCFWHYCFKRKKRLGLNSPFDIGDWFSPWAITIVIWIAILSLYYILDTSLLPITDQFYRCLVIWLPIFIISSLITFNALHSTGGQTVYSGEFHINRTVFNAFFILSLIITPMYVSRVLQVVLLFGTEDLMNNVRTLAIYGEGQGLLNYSIVINQTLLIVALWAHPKIPTWQVITLVVACLMNSLAIMEKESMFFVFVSIVFVLFEKKIIHIRSILLFSIILVVVFYLFNLGRAVKGSQYQEEETLLDFFAMYVLSPPVAFCQLAQDVTPQFGPNTFGMIYYFLSRFGFDVTVTQKLQEFVWVPIPTNVYTCFQPFFVDFGYKGIAFFSWVYGCVSGLLYHFYRKRSFLGCGLYTYMVFALVLQFYQENIFKSLVFLLQFTFFFILFTQKEVRLSLNTARQWK